MSAETESSTELWKHPLVQTLLSEVSRPTIRAGYKLFIPIQKQWKDGDRFVVAGYASVEVIDSQDELIPVEALKEAFTKFMGQEGEYAHCHIMHSNIPVGKVLKSYRDSEGVTWKSGVDDQGLFIVSEIRNDIRKGVQTRELIEAGRLTGYSIGGEALSTSTVCEGKCYTKIGELEIHEISYVDRPANQPSVFTILKSERLVKLAELTTRLPHLIISPGIVKIMGSTVELGKGRDYDIYIAAEKGSFIDRAVQTRIHNELRKQGRLDIWNNIQLTHEPSKMGPFTDYQDLYDLVLLRADSPIRRMALTELPGDGGADLGAVDHTLKKVNKRETKLAEDKKPEEEEEEKKKGDITISTGTEKAGDIPQWGLELSAKLDKLTDLISRAAEDSKDKKLVLGLKKLLFTKPCPHKYPKPKEEEKQEKPEEEEDKPAEKQEDKPKEPEKYPKEEEKADEEEKPEEEEKKQEKEPDEPPKEEDEATKSMVERAIENALKAYGLPVQKRTKIVKPGDESVDFSMEKLFNTPWAELHKIAKRLER